MTNISAMRVIAELNKVQENQQTRQVEEVKSDSDDVSPQTTQPKKKGFSLFGFGFRSEVPPEEQTKQTHKEFKC